MVRLASMPPSRSQKSPPETENATVMLVETTSKLDFAGLGRIAGDADQAIDEPVGIFCALPVIR
jgi:hypothetical protein